MLVSVQPSTMRIRTSRSVFLLSLVLAAAPAAQRTARLRWEPMPDFELLLPDEAWVSTTSGIALPHAAGVGFAAEAEGLTLRVDTDGDGRLDLVSKGLNHHVLLRGERADGTPLVYSVRVQTSGRDSSFRYATGGAMAGQVEGVPVLVVDQDNDGVFNEVGVDAIVVGTGRAASFLSRVVNLEGRLFQLDLDPAGRTATTSAYAGPSGVLDLRPGLRVMGKLAAAVVSDLAGKWSFEVGSAADGLRVPAGVYVFSGGMATRAGEAGRLAAGRMHPLVVESNGRTTLQWGAPLEAEFSAVRVGDRVTIGQSVRYFGRAGEEWIPPRGFARAPKVEVFDAGARTESQVLETC